LGSTRGFPNFKDTENCPAGRLRAEQFSYRLGDGDEVINGGNPTEWDTSFRFIYMEGLEADHLSGNSTHPSFSAVDSGRVC